MKDWFIVYRRVSPVLTISLDEIDKEHWPFAIIKPSPPWGLEVVALVTNQEDAEKIFNAINKEWS